MLLFLPQFAPATAVLSLAIAATALVVLHVAAQIRCTPPNQNRFQGSSLSFNSEVVRAGLQSQLFQFYRRFTGPNS